MTVYNIKRTLNILGFEELMRKLDFWNPAYKMDWLCVEKNKQKRSHYKNFIF
jgi:hypothetical protein